MKIAKPGRGLGVAHEEGCRQQAAGRDDPRTEWEALEPSSTKMFASRLGLPGGALIAFSDAARMCAVPHEVNASSFDAPRSTEMENGAAEVDANCHKWHAHVQVGPIVSKSARLCTEVQNNAQKFTAMHRSARLCTGRHDLVKCKKRQPTAKVGSQAQESAANGRSSQWQKLAASGSSQQPVAKLGSQRQRSAANGKNRQASHSSANAPECPSRAGHAHQMLSPKATTALAARAYVQERQEPQRLQLDHPLWTHEVGVFGGYPASSIYSLAPWRGANFDSMRFCIKPIYPHYLGKRMNAVIHATKHCAQHAKQDLPGDDRCEAGTGPTEVGRHGLGRKPCLCDQATISRRHIEVGKAHLSGRKVEAPINAVFRSLEWRGSQ